MVNAQRQSRCRFGEVEPTARAFVDVPPAKQNLADRALIVRQQQQIPKTSLKVTGHHPGFGFLILIGQPAFQPICLDHDNGD